MNSTEVTQNGGPVAMDAQETEVEEKDNEDDRKLFVGGLSWETTSKDLKEYFTKFGEVTTCTLKTDMDTRRSRGFGFVVFTTIEAVDEALKEKEHKLHGRTIDPKRANPRVKEVVKKIFVGKLDPSVPESEVKEYFSKFGTVEKVELPVDKTKQARRAFCFVEFDGEEAVNKTLQEQQHSIGGAELDVKKAAPSNQNQRGRGGRGGFGFGGRGGGRGGRGGWGGGPYQGYGSDYYGYGQGYGGYGSYGYGAYPDYYGYGQGYGSWPGYDQSYGYGGYGGYDYGGWYGPEQGQQPSSYGKTPKRGGSSGGSGGNYHPYSR